MINKITTLLKIFFQNKKLLNLIKWSGLLILIVVTLCFTSNIDFLHECTPENVKNFVNSYGILAPVVYIILFTLSAVTLFPDSVLAIAGGMCFGLSGGFIFTLLGALGGATFAYFLAKTLDQNFIKKVVKKDMSKLENAMKKGGFYIIFILRLIPLVPFDVISYCAGFAGIKYKDFALGTLVGTIPGIFVYINLGDKATEIGSSSFYLSIALLLALIVGSLFLKKKISFDNIENHNSKDTIEENLIENISEDKAELEA
ncbi:TVP38/TMEM64 family protein [Clostridium sp.]|uniref:TVP38/TMEM64 family protein n=1 Tax=Clostridium sp. TaxID=1506 RepID=UPI002FC8D865